MNYNKYSIAWIYHYLSINLIASCLCVSGVSSQLFQFIQAHFRCNLCAQTPRYDTLLHLNSKFKIKNDSPLGVKTNQKKKKMQDLSSFSSVILWDHLEAGFVFKIKNCVAVQSNK